MDYWGEGGGVYVGPPSQIIGPPPFLRLCDRTADIKYYSTMIALYLVNLISLFMISNIVTAKHTTIYTPQ